VLFFWRTLPRVFALKWDILQTSLFTCLGPACHFREAARSRMVCTFVEQQDVVKKCQEGECISSLAWMKINGANLHF
jgi:hypothetical protein